MSSISYELVTSVLFRAGRGEGEMRRTLQMEAHLSAESVSFFILPVVSELTVKRWMSSLNKGTAQECKL